MHIAQCTLHTEQCINKCGHLVTNSATSLKTVLIWCPNFINCDRKPETQIVLQNCRWDKNKYCSHTKCYDVFFNNNNRF